MKSFQCVVKNAKGASALTVSGVRDKAHLESHLKGHGFELVSIEETRAEADQKAAGGNGTGANAFPQITDEQAEQNLNDLILAPAPENSK